MNENNEKKFITLIKIFIVLAIIGLLVLILTNLQNDPSDIAFSVIAFIISVAALVMTTLQSISISRQLRATQKAVRVVKETGNQVEQLVLQDKKIERELHQDLKLDREIVSVLEEYGVGESEETRQKVARKISRTVRK